MGIIPVRVGLRATWRRRWPVAMGSAHWSSGQAPRSGNPPPVPPPCLFCLYIKRCFTRKRGSSLRLFFLSAQVTGAPPAALPGAMRVPRGRPGRSVPTAEGPAGSAWRGRSAPGALLAGAVELEPSRKCRSSWLACSLLLSALLSLWVIREEKHWRKMVHDGLPSRRRQSPWSPGGAGLSPRGGGWRVPGMCRSRACSGASPCSVGSNVTGPRDPTLPAQQPLPPRKCMSSVVLAAGRSGSHMEGRVSGTTGSWPWAARGGLVGMPSPSCGGPKQGPSSCHRTAHGRTGGPAAEEAAARPGHVG